MDPDLKSLLEVYRESDPDRYLATLWLPAGLRRPIASIYACSAEIAAIPAKVREPVAGEIRLQWWREVLEGSREHAGHPVASAVLETLAAAGLPRRGLADLASAHVFDLYHDPMPDREALETWCGETESVLFQLAALTAGAEPGRALADACGHAGCATGVARLAVSTGWLRTQGKCFIPADLLGASGLTPDEFLEDGWSGRHASAVEAFAALGREHLLRARTAIEALDRRLRIVFLPLATVSARLRRAEQAGAALFDTVPDITPLTRHWLIGKAALSGRIV